MAWQDAPTVYSVDDNTQKFLDFLGKAEGADYNTIVGGGRFDKYDAHPNVVGLRTKEGPSTAAGKYQITNTTYKDVASKLGITDFSPESQDRIALELIKRNGAADDVAKGDYQTAISKLGGTWASLPSSPYSQPKRSTSFVEKALDLVVSPANAKSMPKNSWDSAPVVGEEAPQEAPKAAAGAWNAAPVVGEEPKKVEKPVPESRSALRRVDDFVRGAADALTFGYADELAAKGDSVVRNNQTLSAVDQWLKQKTGGTIGLSQSDKGNYDQALADQRKRDSEGGVERFAGQLATAVLPTVGVVRAVDGASRVARAGAGAATGAIQGALYGSGSAEGDLGDRAEGALKGGAVGAVTGGVLGGIIPATKAQQVNGTIKKAGSAEDAAVNAEVAQAIKREFENPARMVNGKLNPLTPQDLNQRVTRGFLDEAKDAVQQLPKDFEGKSQLVAALNKGTSISQPMLDKLSGVQGGKEVTDIIAKAQRSKAMTDQVLQSPSVMGHLTRMGIDALPPVVGGAIGGPIGAGVGLALTKFVADPIAKKITGKMTKTEVGQKIVDKMAGMSDDILAKTGPSASAQSLKTLQDLAASAANNKKAADLAKNAFKVERQNADKVAEAVIAERWAQGKTANGGVQGTISDYTGLKGKDLVDGIEALAQKYPDLAPQLEKIKLNNGVPGVKTLGTIQDSLADWAIETGKKVDPSVIRKQATGFGVEGAKGVPNSVYSRASGIISKMDDGVLSQVIARDASASGEALKKPRSYAAAKIAKIIHDKNEGRALDEEALGILNLIKDY